MAAAESGPGSAQPPRAADVMAFGHQSGRMLSDGTIVGRAEPFTKVFPSSRAVKRQVGPVAWAILEDIALDARIDDEGRLVAETNIRRIADNLDLSKTTVSSHLKRLRQAGFTFREDTRTDSGAWGASRYVLDPSACLERFTTTPTRQDDETGEDQAAGAVENFPAEADGGSLELGESPRADSPDRPDDGESGGLGPCTSSWDTVEPAVSQFMGHRDLGHNKELHAVEEQPQQQQGERDGQAGGRDGLLDALLAVEVDAEVADKLLAEHPTDRIRDALQVVGARQPDNPAGWVVTAVREGWELSGEAGELRGEQRRRQRQAEQETARRQQRRQTEAGLERTDRWHAAISAGLNDGQLAALLDRIAGRVPAIAATSVPVVCAELTHLVAAAAECHPDKPLEAAVEHPASTGGAADNPFEKLPEPPPICGDPPPLGDRISSLLDGLMDRREPPATHPTRGEDGSVCRPSSP